MATGAVQYAFTGSGYNTPLTIVSGGEWGDDVNPITVDGIGGVGVIVPGPMSARATLELVPENTSCLLDKILRVAGTYGGYPAGLPPTIPLHIGDDAAGVYCNTWRVNTARISMAVNNVLRVSYEVVATGKPSRGINTNTYTPAKTPFVWHNGYVRVDDADMEITSAEISIDNGLAPAWTLNAKSAGSRRWNEAVDVGPEVITVSLTFRENPGHELDDDELETADIALSAVNTAATPVTLSITAAGGKVVEQSTRLVTAGGVREWTARYAFDYSSQALSITLA